jgi:hypothetical protein
VYTKPLAISKIVLLGEFKFAPRSMWPIPYRYMVMNLGFSIISGDIMRLPIIMETMLGL